MAKKTANRALRHFHARGKRANAAGAKRKNRGIGVWGTLEHLGAGSASAKNRLMEARHFARLYDDKQLDKLCALGQKTGRALTRLHVLQLMRVDDRRQRDKLARKCSAKSWSVRQLELEVRRLVPPRRYGGRKQTPPRSIDEALLVTERLLNSLIRWASVVTSLRSGIPETTTRAKRKRVAPARLPKKFQSQLLAITKSAFELCETIRDELAGRRSKPGRRSGKRN
jgi:hypothetical protein